MIGRGFAGLTRVRGTPEKPKLGIIVRRKIGVKRTKSPPKPKERSKPQPQSGIGVRFVAPFFDGSGYAEGARQWLAAMVTAGVDVRAEPVSFETARADYGLAGEMAKKAVNREIDCKISMIYLTPDMFPLHRKEGHYNIGLFEWETDRLPSAWVHECNTMDEIWVPCAWVARVAKAGGVKKRIRVIGHCFNPEEYESIPPMDFPEIPKEYFKFYSIFQWTERKNPVGLLEAYFSAFRKKDPVILILKTYRSNYSADEQHWVIGEIERIRSRYEGNPPKVLLIPEMLTRKEILSLHATGDCFVLPHRSEGWGLPHFDACAMGKPVITTRFGGNLEFTKDGTAYLVDYQKIAVSGMGWIPWYTDDMSWANPDIEQCMKYMRYVYSHRSRALEVGGRARAYLEKNFSHQKVGESIATMLGAIRERR